METLSAVGHQLFFFLTVGFLFQGSVLVDVQQLLIQEPRCWLAQRCVSISVCSVQAFGPLTAVFTYISVHTVCYMID